MAKKAASKAAEPQAASAPAAKSTAKAAKSAAAKPATKTQIFADLADKTKLSKKDVEAVFDGLGELIKKEIGKKGPGQFVLPGLLKIQVVQKPATKARAGFNPATKRAMLACASTTTSTRSSRASNAFVTSASCSSA